MTRNRSLILAIIVMMFALTQLCSCAGGGVARHAKNPKRYYKDYDLAHLPKFDIPMEVNDRVIAWMEYFQGPGRSHFKRYLERSGRYIPMMQEILKRNNLPRDLVYIALIESGFSTSARSFASAVGPWQFISSTGRRYGMRIDGWVDERRDPIRSTYAAADYFKDLYGEFKDWYLAMSAYNAGEGRVRNAIESTGTRNFWDMSDDKRALRPETRDYVPKYIAAAIMAKMPERFGFTDVDYQEPLNFESGLVETQTDTTVVAKCAGVSEDEILQLNPHLVRGATPPEAHNYEIRLPKGKGRIFREKYAALPKEERIQIVRHEVRRGENLARIAKRYGVSARALAAANDLPYSRKPLKAGTTLVIPVGTAAARFAAASAADNESRDLRHPVRHVVTRGETLSTIAHKFKVSKSQILAWNNLKNGKSIRKGMHLVVRAPKESEESVADAKPSQAAGTSHKVHKGDTLQTIASRYGVTVSQIVALNKLGSSKKLMPGTKLIVRRAKTSPSLSDTGAVALGAGKREVTQEHVVGKGETLGKIAKKYNVSTKDLMAMNNIKDPRSIRAGMNLVVKQSTKVAKADKTEKTKAGKIKPAQKEKELNLSNAQATSAEVPQPEVAPSSVTQPANSSTEPAPADTSSSLLPEEKVGSTKAPMSQANNSSFDTSNTPVASAGSLSEKPVIPPKATNKELAANKAPAANKNSGSDTYTVKNGDSLWDIARRHHTSISKLQTLNKLSDPSAVKPGTVLKVR